MTKVRLRRFFRELVRGFHGKRYTKLEERRTALLKELNETEREMRRCMRQLRQD